MSGPPPLVTSLLMILVGVLFSAAAVLATGIRGAFGRSGPTKPLTGAGRATLLAIGLLLLGTGLRRLIR
jgi:hypothetical protein